MKDKIAIITHVTDSTAHNKCLKNLHKCIAPSSFDIELVPIKGESKTEAAYNQANSMVNTKYKMFIRENTIILNGELIKSALKTFKEHPEIAALGVYGEGVTDKEIKRLGKLLTREEGLYNLIEPDYEKSIDGYSLADKIHKCIIFTQTDIYFTKEKGEFYSESLKSLSRKGLKSGVLNQIELYALDEKKLTQSKVSEYI